MFCLRSHFVRNQCGRRLSFSLLFTLARVWRLILLRTDARMHEIISFRSHSECVDLFVCLFYFFFLLCFWSLCNCRNDGLGDGCTILNWDYKHLSSMSYTDAVSYTQSHQRPDTISCFDIPNYSFHFDQEPGRSIVQEVRQRPEIAFFVSSFGRTFLFRCSNRHLWIHFVFVCLLFSSHFSGTWFVRKAFGAPRLPPPYRWGNFWALLHLEFYRTNMVERHAL